MAGVKSGKYSLVEPGSGVTVFSMEGGEINLFGSYTNIITTGVDTYPPIDDNLTSKNVEDKTEQMEMEGIGVTAVLAVLGGAAIIAAPFISIPALGIGSLLLGTVCVSASVETGRYTAETVKNDRITGYDRNIKDFRKGLANSAWAGAQKGAEAFETAMDILSIISGFKGIMGPTPPTAALAGADGEIIAVPEILEVDAGISILYSKSFPDGPFGEKKEVEEKQGVYVKNNDEGTSWYKSDGSINYPPNNGAVPGTEKTITLKPGDILGRYGEIRNSSNFVTKPGADSNQLSLPPNTNPSIYQEFVVINEIPQTTQSEIMPWGGAEGGGVQYELPMPINQLITDGYIVPK